MTRPLPQAVQPLADVLKATETYLWTTVRIPGVTCRVCVRETEGGADLCSKCRSHIGAAYPTADFVGSLVYAPYFTQTYRLVKHYKGANPGKLPTTFASLLALGARGHLDCFRTLAGSEDTRWAVVPSLKNAGAPQTLRTAALTFAKSERETVLHGVADVFDARAFDPGHFTVPPQELPDSVMLFEDSWVGGGHAQSAAAALKRFGVRKVGILNVARVLDPNWEPTEQFIKTQRPSMGFGPERCPWTDGDCPGL